VSDRTKIEWADSTWNPVTGCVKVPGSGSCQNCYASTLTERFGGTPGHYFEHGFDLTLRPERLDQPLRWRRPRRVFVNSLSDVFLEAVDDVFIARIWAVMALTSQHTFQLLTKRHARMRALLSAGRFREAVATQTAQLPAEGAAAAAASVADGRWPLPNVWLGVTAEDQRWAGIQIPTLLTTPAAVRFVSAEPLLGPLVLEDRWLAGGEGQARIDWLIAGGESGRGARPMHPQWARSLRDQCTRHQVAYLFKQWGEWCPLEDAAPPGRHEQHLVLAGSVGPADPQHGGARMVRLGKRVAGRELDGRTWDEFPGPVLV